MANKRVNREKAIAAVSGAKPHQFYGLNATFYDGRRDALSFVTPLLIETLPTLHLLIGFFLAALTLAFLLRIILTWYPQVNLNQGFWRLCSWPTEPFLMLTRRFIAPIGGVDITPVIWLGLISLIRELLVGQQGILTQILLKSKALG